MHMRTLGRELQVSAIGWAAWGCHRATAPTPETADDMIGVLRDAVQLGVTFFDTAESTAHTSTRNSSARRSRRYGTRWSSPPSSGGASRTASPSDSTAAPSRSSE